MAKQKLSRLINSLGTCYMIYSKYREVEKLISELYETSEEFEFNMVDYCGLMQQLANCLNNESYATDVDSGESLPIAFYNAPIKRAPTPKVMAVKPTTVVSISKTETKTEK